MLAICPRSWICCWNLKTWLGAARPRPTRSIPASLETRCVRRLARSSACCPPPPLHAAMNAASRTLVTLLALSLGETLSLGRSVARAEEQAPSP